MVLSKDKERLKRKRGKPHDRCCEEITSLLGLEQIIRMEAYDISNTNGFESVELYGCLRKENQSGMITGSSKSRCERTG